jgi:hypothetical protein
LERIERRVHRAPMRRTHALILSDKSGDANGLAWLEGKVPSGAMSHLLAALRFNAVLVLDQLLARERMLTFRQPIECLAFHRTT